MDGVQQLDEIIPLIEAVVDRITPDQLDTPTACANFSVTGVSEHMIDGATHFSPAFRGGAAGSAPQLEGEITDRWRRAMAARYTAFDGLVHGWDLSRATGLPYEPPDGLIAEVDAGARQIVAFSGRQIPRT